MRAKSQNALGATSGPNSDKIDNRIENLSNDTKMKRNSRMDFLTFGAKEAFIHLQKPLINTQILKHIDPGRHIRIDTNASKYTISKVFC